jgi:phosphoribosylformylglycinamidine (FGAM) synthase PurS component
MYKVELELMGKKYSAKGDTISKAFSNLAYPKSTKSGVITVTQGNKKATHKAIARQLNKLIYNEFVQALLAKRLMSLLK